MSLARDIHSAQFTHYALNRRTIAEIEENVVEKSRRKLLSRLVHAKNDREVMAAWRSDLNRGLHIFNVRSVGFGNHSLSPSRLKWQSIPI